MQFHYTMTLRVLAALAYELAHFGWEGSTPLLLQSATYENDRLWQKPATDNLRGGVWSLSPVLCRVVCLCDAGMRYLCVTTCSWLLQYGYTAEMYATEKRNNQACLRVLQEVPTR